MKIRFFITAFLLMIIIPGCSPEIEPINYGKDACEYCKMNITDNKFAAEIVSMKSKVYKFDSIECLFAFEYEKMIDKNEIHSEWVCDFSDPGKLIELRKAFYLHNDDLRSPMGLNVLCLSSKEKLEDIKKSNGGTELTFTELKTLAEEDL
ncbi:MAG: nitrous oxide reductase accessory protein NosL [Ignavibacteriales bacterium]|nr:nitrous oxide reductase accessory protein NosL [Ignavibacteriales bacterium]